MAFSLSDLISFLSGSAEGIADAGKNPAAALSPFMGAGAGRGVVVPPAVIPTATTTPRPGAPAAARRPAAPAPLVNQLDMPEAAAAADTTVAPVQPLPPPIEVPSMPPIASVMAGEDQPLEFRGTGAQMGPPSSPQPLAGLEGFGPGLLSRMGFQDGNQALMALGGALAAAGSPDPVKAALAIQQQQAEKEKQRQETLKANQPKIVGSAAGGAVQIVQYSDGRIVPMPVEEAIKVIQQQKTADFQQDVAKAVAVAAAQDKIRAAAEERKAEREGAGERVQAGLNVQQLNQIADSLEKTDTATGPVLGLLPKFVRDVITPQGASLQDAAERIIQGGLRATLGGQFTQVEGDRFLARAYNPRLDEKQNAQNLRTIAREIASIQLDKKNALDYFQKNGTLEGFVPNANPQAADAPAAAPAPQAGAVARPTSKAAFDALPKGTRFIAPDGKEYIK